MSSSCQGSPAGDPAVARRLRLRRRWIPPLWIAYGCAYVIVFALRGQLVEAVTASVAVIGIGVGIARELRGPQATTPRLAGWEQDERQRLIHLRAAALTGYVTAAGLTIAGFIAFATNRAFGTWAMNALIALALVYGVGLVYYRRHG